MECLLGLACKDFAIIAADQTNAHSIIVMNNEENKLFKISNHMAMGITGESGDTTQFAEFIAKNIQLYKMRHGYELSPSAAANFTRKTLAQHLRSSTPYMVNMLLGGYDTNSKESGLYFIDYLGSFQKVPFATHGYGGFFCMGIMDRFHREDMTVDEAYDVLRKCVTEIHKRLIVNLPNFKVQVIDKNGIRDLEPLTAKKLQAPQ
ncbi:proteasome subunit beta type-2 [Frankliniella occidentalis]|uniref:Proteasome subunit beta n=1 Tax=Frankliniella occidentalis TaxID=133901 RepID=A0A6J1S9U4_FRAOC|nr:proteasome subunit beta type-2 [Frankliniella occidentalis]